MAELRELTYPARAAAQAIADIIPVPAIGPSVAGARIGRTVTATAAVEPIPDGSQYALFLTEDQAGSHPSIRGQSIAEVARTVPDPGARIRDELEEG